MIKKNETSLYIIDNEYNLLSFNENLRSLFPNIERKMKCYKIMNNENAPCKNCPLNSGYSSGLYYNSILNRVVSVSSTEIIYNNVVATALIGTAYNDDINFDNEESYVIFEINNDFSLSLLHAVKPFINKRFISIDDVIDYLSIIIFPLDRKKLLIFFDKNNLNDKTENFRLIDNSIEFTYDFNIKTLPNDSKILTMRLIKKADSIQDVRKIHNLTKLYYQNYYFDLVLDFLDNSKTHSMIAIDIKDFKMFNEWYGESEGDLFLSFISKKLLEIASKLLSFSGYIQADNFVSIVEDDKVDSFIEILTNEIKKYKNGDSFLLKFGIYKINDYSISPRSMYDRAAIAISNINQNKNICYYQKNMLFEIENEHILTRDIERGLSENEFCFYLQPQCNMYTGKIVSAEALVRWKHKDYGLIPPIKFIPLLEKTGGIIELDKYVWKEVFIWIRKIIDKNIQPVPISLNVSRVDMELFDVPKYLKNLSEKYKISPELIEIEITESAYSSKIKETEEIVRKLHEYGFKIAMDDFGSGYSSLNMLNKINIDILKLDMKFLDFDEQHLRKGINILESVINMIKNMRTPIIIEGVETDKEEAALIEMGCRFAQGYFYHKPMPVDQFEELLFEAINMDYSGVYYHSNEKFHLKDFFLSNLYSDTLLNNVLGPVAEFKVQNNEISIYRINNPFYELFINENLYDEEFRKNISHIIHKDDFNNLLNSLNEAKKNPITGSLIDFRVYNFDKIKWLHTKIFYLKKDSNNKDHYIGCFEDITINKEKDNEIRRLNNLNNAILSLEKIKSWEYSFETDIFKIYFYDKEPLIINDTSINIRNGNIVPKEYNFISESIFNRINNLENSFTYEFPVLFNGITKWCQVKFNVIFENDKPKYIFGLYRNISELIKKRFENTSKSKLLLALRNMSHGRIIVNLNTDLIYHSKIDKSDVELINIKRFSRFLEIVEERYINNNSKNRIKELLDTKLLITEYYGKRNFKSFDYITKDGIIKRVCVYLKQFDDSNDIYGYFYFINLDKKIKNQNFASVSNDLFPYLSVDYINLKADCNQLLVDLLHFNTKDELLSNIDKMMKGVFKKEDILALKNTRSLLKNVGDCQSCEFEYRLDDGNIINIYMLTKLLENSNNEKYYLSTYLDVTNNKLFEKALLNTTFIENVDSGIAELANRFSIEDKVMFSSISSIYSTSFFVNTYNNLGTNIYSTYNKLMNYQSLNYDQIRNIYLEKVSSIDKDIFINNTSIHVIKNNLKCVNDRNSFIYRAIDENGNEYWEKASFFAAGFNHNNELNSFVVTIEDINEYKVQIDNLSYSTRYFKDLFFQASKELYKYIFRFKTIKEELSSISINNNEIIEKKLEYSIDDFINYFDNRLDKNIMSYIKKNFSKEEINKANIGSTKQFKIDYINDLGVHVYYKVLVHFSMDNEKIITAYVIDETKDEIELRNFKIKSEIDELTGLLNRRRFETDINNKFINYSQITIVFFDVNNLKYINDEYGHENGDIVIKNCASCLKNLIDDETFGYRYGGDEFVLVTTNKNKEEIENLVIEEINKLELKDKNSRIKSSLSFGISYGMGKWIFSDLLKEADENMYLYKKEHKK